MQLSSTRADARRSRRLLLEAGTAAFTECGLDVQVSEITRRAGLAKGTFFRHFPTKRALIAAILVENLKQHIATANALLAQPTDDMVEQYMTACAEQQVPIRAVIESTILHGFEDSSIGVAMGELIQTLGKVLTEAKARGEIRDDVTALDLHHLLLAATLSSAHFFFRDHPELWRRYLAITLDGLHPAAAHPLPIDAPDLTFPHGTDADQE